MSAHRTAGVRWAALSRDARFRVLKRRHTRAATLLAVSFLGWYLLYVLLAAFARDLMARPVFGNVNVALLLGLLQFASTFLFAGVHTLYTRYAIDPLAGALRAEAERARPEQEPEPDRRPRSLAHERPAVPPALPPAAPEPPAPVRNHQAPAYGRPPEAGGPAPGAGPRPGQGLRHPASVRGGHHAVPASFGRPAERPAPSPERARPAAWPQPAAGVGAPRTAGAARRPGAGGRRSPEPASGLRRDQVSGVWTDLGRAARQDAGPPGDDSARRPGPGAP